MPAEWNCQWNICHIRKTPVLPIRYKLLIRCPDRELTPNETSEPANGLEQDILKNCAVRSNCNKVNCVLFWFSARLALLTRTAVRIIVLSGPSGLPVPQRALYIFWRTYA